MRTRGLACELSALMVRDLTVSHADTRKRLAPIRLSSRRTVSTERKVKAARVAAKERGQRVSFNRGKGISEIKGKAVKVATSERG